ncbi:MAG: aminotransferase class I/II-fold pyridoxal phosphate-dependent enzyme [Frankiaceae bacterium]
MTDATTSVPAASAASAGPDRSAQRYRAFGTSVFSRLTELANSHGAVNLAQGFPDFGPPPALIEAAAEAMAAGVNQYSPSVGLPALREAVAAHVQRHHGAVVDPVSEVTITVGATEALWCAVQAFVEPGDEVLIVEPFYESYPACVVATGATVRYLTTRWPDFRITEDALEHACSARTKLIVVNTPMNPTGRVLTREELALVGRFAARYGAVIVSDEPYEHLVYSGRHLPVAGVPECSDRTITVSSVSKTFNATGWRVGWALAPAPLTAALRRVHQFVTFAGPSPLQAACAAMLSSAAMPGYVESLRENYARRRETLLGYLTRPELGLEVREPEGAFFVLTRCPGDDVAYCTSLIERAGVAAIPASVFYADPDAGRGLVRFAFCKRIETLEAAGDRLLAAARAQAI